jgi:hypothetical protein
MATPSKKMYDRKGKLIFDPSNPEDVRRQEEINKQIEMAKELFSIVDPRGGGGIGAMARGISKAALAKMSKSKFTQNKAKQLADLITKPMTRGKKAVTKKATPTVKEIVETKPTIPTNIPTSGTTVPNRIKSLNNAEIKAFETVKNIRELAEKQVKNISVPKDKPYVSVSDHIRELMRLRRLSKKGPTREEMKAIYQKHQKAKNVAKEILDNKKFKTESEKIREANKPFYEKSISEAISKSNKKIAIGTNIVGGLATAGGVYYGMQSLSNKDNKQTTNTQKTGPVDLKRIDKSKLKPSKVEGVYITSALVDGKIKDFGIKWNNSTSKWEYYKGGGKPVVKQTTPKQETVKDNTGGGGYTPIKDNKKTTGTGGGNQTTTTGGTGSTKPTTTPTVTKTPLMGDEYYKKNPSLATLRQQDDDKQLLARAEAQKKEMMEFEPTTVLPTPTKPLSSLVFKTAPLNPKTNSRVEPVSYTNIETNSKKLKKKRYGGNLAMLKYMK